MKADSHIISEQQIDGRQQQMNDGEEKWTRAKATLVTSCFHHSCTRS